MKKRNATKKSRSRRKPAKNYREELKRLGVEDGRVNVQLSLPIAEALSGAYGAVEELSVRFGMCLMQGLIEDQVEQVAGKRYAHDPERTATRWGHEESHLNFGGKKMPFRRPRVRSVSGNEVPLDRVELFQRDGALQQSVAKQVVAGVSMRDYEGVVDEFCDAHGIRRSSVSRHWKAISAARLAEFAERPLGDLDLVALMIDGIDFRESLLVVALGIDSEGRKHVLGLWDGATENAEVCTQLLEDLVERGVPTDRRYLFVLDGSKALRKAVLRVFGKQSAIQRCVLHKERNILEHLPKSYHRQVRMRLKAALKMKDYEEAKTELLRLQRYLKDLNPSAAGSLEEALEDLLTLHRLEVPPTLRRSLRTTNPIESCFSTTRKFCRNVKRWRKGDMVMRWAGTMLLEAQKRFRRLRGFQAMPQLVGSLGRVVDSSKAAG